MSTATIVTREGKRLRGRITNWIGPGECEVDNGTGARATGYLVETYERREARRRSRSGSVVARGGSS